MQVKCREAHTKRTALHSCLKLQPYTRVLRQCFDTADGGSGDNSWRRRWSQAEKQAAREVLRTCGGIEEFLQKHCTQPVLKLRSVEAGRGVTSSLLKSSHPHSRRLIILLLIHLALPPHFALSLSSFASAASMRRCEFCKAELVKTLHRSRTLPLSHGDLWPSLLQARYIMRVCRFSRCLQRRLHANHHRVPSSISASILPPL